jgi:hypothetical protein
MGIPRRFTLTALLLLVTFGAALFGYAAWRKQAIKAEAVRLNREGISHVEITDHWFWPMASKQVYVLWRQDGANFTTLNDAKLRFARLSDRLHAIGVREVTPAWIIEEDEKGNLTLMIKPIASLDELVHDPPLSALPSMPTLSPPRNPEP